MLLTYYTSCYGATPSIMSDGDTAGPQTSEPSHPALRNIGESRNENSSTATQRSDSFAGTSTTPNTSESTNSAGENEQLTLVKELEEVVESFWGRNISRTKAVTQVLGILGRTLLSRIVNPRKRPHSAHTSPKSFPSNLPSTEWIPTEGMSKHPRVSSPGLRKECQDMTVDPTQSLKTRMTNPIREPNSSNLTCLGMLTQINQQLIPANPVARKPVGYCEPTIETSPRPNFLSKSLPVHQAEFPLRNGNESSKAKQSTSIKSSHHSTMLSLMKRERVAWETRKSVLELQRRRKEYGQQQNGPQHGDVLQKSSSSPSPIDERSSLNMVTILNQSSQQNCRLHTLGSSSTMLPSGTKLL